MYRRRLLTYLLAGLTLPVSLRAMAQQQVLAARGARDGEKLRVVLELSGPVQYQSFELGSPPRLILDLHGTRLMTALRDPSLLAAPIKAIRSSPRGAGDTRVVLEFDEPVQSKTFLLPPGDGKGHRLVLDLQTQASHAIVQAAPAAAVAPAVVEKVERVASNKPQRDIIVVVDAGHGGKDPGAIGGGGQQEKHVALAIARMLAQRIDRQKGFKARLVRNDDVFVPLRKRVDVAHKYNADMFVSVHADAAPNLTASGASVFALSEHGATSAMARYMADTENSADMLGSRQLLTLKDKDPMLADVILDMSMNSTISASLDLGNIVLGHVGKVAGVHGMRVEQAGFAVLKSPDIPSILVETGFISNSSDCRRLIDSRHQQNLADAIFTGVTQYFGRNPPEGTYLAEVKGNSMA
ncbi:N-acetylmuramoyl-L-alanine amidase [Pseudomonas sp. dw_358]|uniref:N-acetylmuramoyl-L-alanine amidase n=1 Tax=Pseudomonas sp. dw_358 TaxID=2720083 RepID=UPI001BD5760C|nr:N-acetylmuramoyl-L-alanine amidase [Pseudomonas sp. dw_358]